MWRFHALLRSLSLTGQDHIISEVLGLEPGNYHDEEYEVSSGTRNQKALAEEGTKASNSATVLSERLVKGWIHR